MKNYLVDVNKQKNVYKNYIKSAVWKCGWFVKFSYVFEKILLIFGVVLGIANIAYVLFFSHDPLDLLFLIMTCGFPYGFSLIFKTVYKSWSLREYIYREHEMISFNNNQFEYSYNDSRLDSGKILIIKCQYSKITNATYNKSSGEISLYGELDFEERKQGISMHSDVWSGIALLNIFEIDIVEELKKYNADIMVVIAFGQILPKEILQMTPYGCINVHASLLPKYRGAAPIQWAVIDGEKVSGVTTMQMNEGLDTGDMILKTEIPLDPKETGGSLHDKLAEAGAKLCVETLKCLEDKTATWEPQGESTTAYAKMLDKNLGNINWNDPAVQIERLIRGLNPWPSAYTHWNDKVIKLWQADVVEENTDQEAGTIVKVEKDSFYVQTGEGLLKIEELQLQGKKRMDAGAFLRGNHLEYGEILKKC